MNNKNIKIIDVATRANVSAATVSRVLNNKDIVKDKTAQKVMKAMEELSYSPNASARGLRKRESRAILVLTPDFTNPFYSHILMGIGERANQLQYNSLILSVDSEDKASKQLKELLDSQRADGAILLSVNIDYEWLIKFGKEYPLVLCAEYGTKEEDIPHVSIDNYKAMCDMTKYIQSLGHKKIGLVINHNKYISTELRRKAFIDTMREMEEAYDVETYIYYGESYGFETGVKAFNKLYSINEPPTAIMCISDILALGVIQGAIDKGLSVPKDLSVTGFDDVDYTKMFHPYLTTVKQPCYELGQKSMDLLYNMLKGRTYDTEVFIPYEIKERESADKLV